MVEELARQTGLQVQQMDAGMAEALWQLPRGQNRTSTHKAFVFICGDEIRKGPYGRHSLKLLNNLRYPYLIHLMEESLQLPGHYRGTYRWRRLLIAAGGQEPAYFLAGENVGRPERMQVEQERTAVDPEGVLVVRRGTLVQRVSELEKQKLRGRYVRHPDFDERIAIASLQHLYFRSLCSLGDSGTHNILVRADADRSDRLIAGIDFDERRRGKDSPSVLGYFFKKEHPYQEEIYGPFLSRIVQLEEDSTLQKAVQELNALCREWLSSLPLPHDQRLAADCCLDVGDLVRRRQRMRELLGSHPSRL